MGIFLKVVVRRLIEKPYNIEERYDVAGKVYWNPVSLMVETAIERQRFIAFTDTKVAGWQRNPREKPQVYDYAYVALEDEDDELNDDED